MRGSFRKSMTWLHTWSGVVFCWVLYFIFVTGTLGYFDAEIDRWMKPEVPIAQETSLLKGLSVGVAHLSEQAPDADVWRIFPAGGREQPNLRVFWQKNPQPDTDQEVQRGDAIIDSVTGAAIDDEIRATGGGQTLYRMHYRLHYLPTDITFKFIGIVTFLMFLALLTGVIAHRKIFKDFFTFRMKRTKGWLDIHNLLSISSLPFHLMITYSGLIFMVTTWMPLIAMGSYGFDSKEAMKALQSIRPQVKVERVFESRPMAELGPIVETIESAWGEGQIRTFEINVPGDANAKIVATRKGDTSVFGSSMTFDGISGELLDEKPQHANVPLAVGGTLVGLHEGHFAGPLLRWLYFFAGLVGTAMIATGAIYWIEKRKTRGAHLNPSAGFRFIDNLNIGTIIGLPIGIAAYFWANRLLPLGMEGRAEWEVHCMFLTWSVCLLYPLFRPRHKAWSEQCWFAALAFTLLPLLNALTTNAHLGNSLPNGDWVLAGFDLTVLVVGGLFALAGFIIYRRSSSSRVATETTPNILSQEQ